MGGTESVAGSVIGSDEIGEGKIVLKYGDSLLREADVRLLEPGGWINDIIVGFIFEWVFGRIWEVAPYRTDYLQY